MGIVPPAEKFDVPNEILGYAMEWFSAGRAETKIRHVEVPVAPLDFISEDPTVAALMDLMEILRAKRLTFEDATSEVQKRYTTYERDGKKIIIIDPKAHGLGYLYPPADSPPRAVGVPNVDARVNNDSIG